MSLITKLMKSSMGKFKSCSVVIAAAGASERMGGEDKLFLEIHGAPVLAHSLMAFQNCNSIDEIVVVAGNDHLSRIGEICKHYGIGKASKIMLGGATRLESVINGVFAVSNKSQLIAIHDGARPCISEAVIMKAITAATKYHAAAPSVPVSSTLKKAENGTVLETISRDNLFEIQTPQVFTAELIKAALTNAQRKSLDVTDDCMAVELIGFPVHITDGSRTNIKLTTKEDIFLIDAILKGS